MVTIEQRLRAQIDEWQKYWQSQQDYINKLLKEQDFINATRAQIVATTIKRCIQDAYNILDMKDHS